MHPRTYGIYGYLAAGGATLGGVAMAAALLGDRDGRIWWPISRAGSLGMLRVCGVTSMVVEGGERLEACRPAVLVANHESLFDPAVVMRAAQHPLRFVVKDEVRRVPIFGRALEAMGHVFVDRTEGGGGLDRAAAAIAAGRTVLVFPEGTRADSDALLPFKSGAFRLALQAGVPILPLGLGGTRRVLPKRGGFQRRGAVAVVVGEPISTAGASPTELVALVARGREEVHRLRERARELAGCA